MKGWKLSSEEGMHHKHGDSRSPFPVSNAQQVSLWPVQDGSLESSTHGRKARLHVFPSPGPHNSLWYYPRVTGGYLPVLRNAALIYLARYVPFIPLKSLLYRLSGITIGRYVSVGLMVMVDIFFPQDITIGDDSIIGYNSVILCHEFMRYEWRRGPVWIGRDVTIGANTTILPGVVIGDGATVSAMSLVNRDVAPGDLVGGVPIRVIRSAAEMCASPEC
jgi:acetyltransferase-like isoleucine patch superfamily enzyme